MDEKNREKLKFWLEAGLALLLVLTLGLAGARGVFTKDAQGKSASIEAKEENGQGAEDEGDSRRGDRRRAISDHGREYGHGKADGVLF